MKVLITYFDFLKKCKNTLLEKNASTIYNALQKKLCFTNRNQTFRDLELNVRLTDQVAEIMNNWFSILE